MTTPSLQPVRAAIAAGDFARAHSLLADWQGPATPELLELRGRAAYGAGDLEATLTAYEDLHRLELDAGRSGPAAIAAVMVAMYLMTDSGLMSPVRAWLRRAEQLVESEPDSEVWAWLSAVRTYERFMCGDMATAGRWARRAIDEAARHQLTQPALIGRVALGRVQIHDGHVEDGLQMLDDVALELIAGDIDPMTAGQMWCEVICAMHWVGQYDRAEEWTRAMERWRRGAAFGGLHGRCRVHRAEIMRMRGPCDAAEQEALLACEELRPWMRREYGWPLTELGNARLRKGDFAGAEEAFLAAHQNAWSPQPGLALLRLAQGRVDEAASLIANALEHPFEIPSKEYPPSGNLRRAPLLDAQVPIGLAAGDLATARRAAEELADIAKTYRSRALESSARTARGRIALAEGNHAEAIRELTVAVTEWSSLRMPFETALARADLAAAHRLAGDVDAAELELAAACRTLVEIGAAPWRDIVCGEPSATPAPAPSAEPTACVFRRDGDMRIMRFEGRSVTVKDLKGMRYIERLLAEPRREFHALDVVSVERGALPTSGFVEPEVAARCADAPLEVFDSKAREAYRRRLRDIEEDIAEAEANNDLERARLARADRQFLVDELARGVGLNDRARTVGGGAERARTSVTRTIRYAISRIAEHHPELANHLTHAIRTGSYVVYDPDRSEPLDWEI